MAYNFFDKKSSGANISSGTTESKIMPNQQLAEESHKAIIKKMEKRKIHSSFKGNILDPDLVDM